MPHDDQAAPERLARLEERLRRIERVATYFASKLGRYVGSGCFSFEHIASMARGDLDHVVVDEALDELEKA